MYDGYIQTDSACTKFYYFVTIWVSNITTAIATVHYYLQNCYFFFLRLPRKKYMVFCCKIKIVFILRFTNIGIANQVSKNYYNHLYSKI